MTRIHLPRNVSTVALPHYSGAISISKSMWSMSLALMPLLLWGFLLFGFRSLLVVAVSVVSALGFEALAILFSRGSAEVRSRLSDGSAVLTGLLLGLTLPVGVSLMVPVFAVAFGILVVKWSFGGLGNNWINPALAGRLLVYISWSDGYQTRSWGRTLLANSGWHPDALSAATDLQVIKQTLLDTGSPRIFRPLQLVSRNFSTIDQQVTKFINDIFLRPNGSILPDGYADYFLGIRPGAIGEVSIILILVISLYLFARGIISWQIPAMSILSMGVLSFALGGSFWGADLFSGDALFALSAGGFLFAAFFMATDPVTTPYTSAGKILFGLGFGTLCFVFREYSTFAEGSALALLIMNMMTPLIGRITRKRPFGYGRKGGHNA